MKPAKKPAQLDVHLAPTRGEVLPTPESEVGMATPRTMSNTPETDAALLRAFTGSGANLSEREAIALAVLSRRLERERDRLRGALEVCIGALNDACHATAIYGDQPPEMYLDVLAQARAALAQSGEK